MPGNERYSVYHTDDYMEFGFEQSLYKLLADVDADENPYRIVEGVQGYRFVRKLLKRGTCPSLIVATTATLETRRSRYRARSDGDKDFATLDKSLSTGWQECLALIAKGGHRPKMLDVKT